MNDMGGSSWQLSVLGLASPFDFCDVRTGNSELIDSNEIQVIVWSSQHALVDLAVQ